jgi:PEP-CTERM motif
MKCWFGRLLTLTCLLFATTSVRADPIAWSYAWTRTPVSVPSDANGTGGISLTLGQGLPMTGDSDITAVNLSTFSSAPAGTIDHFTHSPFTLGLNLTDTASGQTGTTSFAGEFSGTLSPTSAGITATYDQTPHTLTLGSHLYTIALTSFAAPGIPDSTTVGSIGAHVAVSDVSSGGLGGGSTGGGGGGGSVGVSDVPEPATLLLAGLASPALGLVIWRRLAARAAAQAA